MRFFSAEGREKGRGSVKRAYGEVQDHHNSGGEKHGKDLDAAAGRHSGWMDVVQRGPADEA